MKVNDIFMFNQHKESLNDFNNTMKRSVNDSSQTLILSMTVDLTFTWQAGTLFGLSLITILVNSLILLAFYTEKKLRTYSNYYILNMTVADLLVGLVCMPIRALIFAFDRTWMLGGTFCYIFIGVQHALPGVSVFGVVVICFDRYLATSYPLHHYRWKTKKTAVVINALTWFIPCSIWLSISTFWDLARPRVSVTRSGWCDPNYSRYFISSTITVLLRAIIPFVTLAILSVQIYRRAKSAGRKSLGGRSFRSISATKRDDKFSSTVSQDQIMYEVDAKRTERSTDTPSSNVEAEHENCTSSQLKDGLHDKQICNTPHSGGLKVFTFSANSQDHLSGQESVDIPTVTARLSFAERVGTKMKSGKGSADGAKAMRTLILLLIAFFITWLPSTVVLISRSISPTLITNLPYIMQLRESVRWISFCNSTINPLAYAVAQPLICRVILKLFCTSLSE
ncbi:muscarinic acetylcholine receptor M2-like [Diadema antillarum]|uniref:muscarinic acetylcholine receptor M2-like n=1 Tax=Diadema antillarum TaxID=105358 RepID=UPI003A8BD52F